jgi:hypothetical protein
MGTARQGDIGFIIEIEVVDEEGQPRNLSGASIKEFHVQPPSPEDVREWTAEFVNSGTDGLLKYTTVENDLDVVGIWSFQVYIEDGSVKLHSKTATERLTVEKALCAPLPLP